MIILKQNTNNLVPLTLKERNSSTNKVLANYIASNYINIGYFLSAQITEGNYVMEITSNQLKGTKTILLQANDNATLLEDRYDLWVFNLVDQDEEDLPNYKISLGTGRYDYRVLNDLDEIVESGILKVIDDTAEQFDIVIDSQFDDTTFVFK
jgi:hypothetical protein